MGKIQNTTVLSRSEISETCLYVRLRVGTWSHVNFYRIILCPIAQQLPEHRWPFRMWPKQNAKFSEYSESKVNNS